MKRKAIIKTAVALLAAAMLLLPATAAAAEIDFTPVAAEGDNTEAVELPSYYSSLDLGYTTSVKHQRVGLNPNKRQGLGAHLRGKRLSVNARGLSYLVAGSRARG